MKEFDVTISETLNRTVTVTAENQEQAEHMVEDAWEKGKLILGGDDFHSVDFFTIPQREVTPMLTALLVAPGETPKVVELPNTLSALQTAVDGHIQAVSPFADPVVLICGEESKIHHQPLNRALYDREGDLVDIIAGPFLMTGLDEEEFASLSPALMEKYCKHFEKPERFYTICGQIVVQKEEADKDKSSMLKTRPSER